MMRARTLVADEQPCSRLGLLPLPALGALPPPLRGRAGEGGGCCTRFARQHRPPPPTPPHKGEGRRAPSNGGKCGSATRALAACLTFFLLLPAFALDFPALSGRVVDDADILDATTRTALTGKLAALEAKSTDQLVVVTLKSLQGTSIEDFGVQLGRKWQIGQKDKNNGVLLIVVPSERKVRIEVGYGLEGTLTDAISKLIIANSIIPRFRANDYPGGITRGVDDIISVLSGDATQWQQLAAKRPDPAPIWVPLLVLSLIVIAFILVFVMIVDKMPSSPQPRRRGRTGDGWLAQAGPLWSSGGFSGGGFGGGSGGGGSSGGGFSGGGGSFGGGGASGSW
jgi:uncharacterized protein